MSDAAGTVATTAKAGRQALTEDEERKLSRLFDKAQGGDKKALDELRPILDKAGLWDYIGDLGRKVQESWLEALTGRNNVLREAYEKRAAALRRELLEAGDSPLERLLVERIVAAWIQVSHADVSYATLLTTDGHTFKQGSYYQDRQDRASARYLKAIKALASVRRLLVPAVQVNIGRNQIITQQGGGDPP